ncbi:MAG: phosphate transport system substrate-binding protein, partial [Pseudonocardiales bacterium]|nr:phosphate transport system substrate-binding protein [Pseudonocardiales bacterium]
MGIAAGLVAGALALAACSSSSNNGNSTSSAGASASNSASVACGSGSLKGEGSTAQKNAMDQWISDYQAKCNGSTVNYNATGSGAGVQQFNGKQVDFAGSDSALDPTKGEVAAAAKACGSPAYDLPMVTGPIAVAYNLKGVSKLTLTPSLIAQIFLGKITKWDDAAIKAANSGVSLPSTNISVFFRSDASGTTQNFEKYLAAAAPSDYTTAASKTWSGKTGSGKKGSDGVQQGVSGVDGGIGYMEWSFAQNGNLGVAQVDNGAGPVELTADSAAKAVQSAKVTGTGGDLTLKLDYATKTAGAYPIVLVTYEIV